MKLQQIKNSLLVSLPIGICRAKGWEKGDNLKVEIDGKGNLVLKKV